MNFVLDQIWTIFVFSWSNELYLCCILCCRAKLNKIITISLKLSRQLQPQRIDRMEQRIIFRIIGNHIFFFENHRAITYRIMSTVSQCAVYLLVSYVSVRLWCRSFRLIKMLINTQNFPPTAKKQTNYLDISAYF